MWVIDTQTFQVVDKFPVGIEVQHVVPSWDMTAMYATDDLGNVVRRIDPITGKAGDTIGVFDPYNMYFTPDGKSAISVAEAYRTLVWYDPATWQEIDRVRYPDCKGIDHGDFTPDGKIAVFSCEFDGRVAVIDMQTRQLIRMIDMPTRNYTMGPQDLRIAPDGSKFYIADSDSDGVWVLDKDLQTVTKHIATGDGAHGLYFSRDAKQLYVTNRHEGSISVLDAYTGDIITKWQLPGGGSPDMGNVSADGSQLWLSGRYDSVVYVISHRGRQPDHQDPGRERPARTGTDAATRPLLDRAHRHHPLIGPRPIRPGDHCGAPPRGAGRARSVRADRRRERCRPGSPIRPAG